MRMAEVYLLAAEAEQQLGNGTKAAEYLNVLRKRAARDQANESSWKLTTATEEDILMNMPANCVANSLAGLY